MSETAQKHCHENERQLMIQSEAMHTGRQHCVSITENRDEQRPLTHALLFQ